MLSLCLSLGLCLGCRRNAWIFHAVNFNFAEIRRLEIGHEYWQAEHENHRVAGLANFDVLGFFRDDQ